MTIPAITISGTYPSFYLILVIEALSNAVMSSQYLETPTAVSKHVTALADTHHPSLGMEYLEYRKVALGSFITFKNLTCLYWDEILVGF